MSYKTPASIKAILAEKIPVNTVVPEHTETAHYYRHVPSGRKFASVTTKGGILDAPHLKKWAAGLAADFVLERVDEIVEADEAGNTEVRDNIRKAAVNAHQNIFEDAGDIGTVGHGFVDEYLQEWMNTGVKPKDIVSFVKHEDPRAYAIARSAELFMDEWRVQPIASELLVASVKYGFAGTLDSLMMVTRVTKKGSDACTEQTTLDGSKPEHDYWSISTSNPGKLKCMTCGQLAEEEFALVDWKTSNSIDKVEYAMQTSAYWTALREMTGLTPKHIYIVRLDKKQARYEIRRVVARPAAFRAFVYCTKIYDWLNDGVEKVAPVQGRERVALHMGLDLAAGKDSTAIEFTSVN